MFGDGAGSLGVGTRICNCDDPPVVALPIEGFSVGEVRLASPMRSVLRGGTTGGAPVPEVRVDCACTSCATSTPRASASVAKQRMIR